PGHPDAAARPPRRRARGAPRRRVRLRRRPGYPRRAGARGDRPPGRHAAHRTARHRWLRLRPRPAAGGGDALLRGAHPGGEERDLPPRSGLPSALCAHHRRPPAADSMMHFLTHTTWTELYLLAVAFVLCALNGIERQVRQKPAGFRTQVLVGMGAAGFTPLSAFGLPTVLGEHVNLHPSRIAAQIDSGIGFRGAGVLFTRRDVVSGLTTAATIWVAAAVGMAAGAGMVSLAFFLTALHLLAVVAVGPLVRKIPTRDHNRVLRVRYLDGAGVLRDILALR